MSNLNDWDVIASNNNDAPPDGWPENMAYSAVNNSGRENMAAIKRHLADNNGTLVATGVADVYAVTLNANYSAYFNGMTFRCQIPATNLTTTPTINVNGLGAKTITTPVGNLALRVSTLSNGFVYSFRYNGLYVELLDGSVTVGEAFYCYDGLTMLNGAIDSENSMYIRVSGTAHMYLPANEGPIFYYNAVEKARAVSDGFNVSGQFYLGSLQIDGGYGTGASAATFSASNKPGGSGTAPAQWMNVRLGGTLYYIPCWT